MAITVKNMSELFNKDVFTNKGVYAGKVADMEINLSKFRIRALVIEAAKGSFLSSIVGGKRGVIVPYQLVDNIGDVVIIKHITTPTMSDDKEGAADDSTGITPF